MRSWRVRPRDISARIALAGALSGFLLYHAYLGHDLTRMVRDGTLERSSAGALHADHSYPAQQLLNLHAAAGSPYGAVCVAPGRAFDGLSYTPFLLVQ